MKSSCEMFNRNTRLFVQFQLTDSNFLRAPLSSPLRNSTSSAAGKPRASGRPLPGPLGAVAKLLDDWELNSELLEEIIHDCISMAPLPLASVLTAIDVQDLSGHEPG